MEHLDTSNYEWLHREGETPIKGWVRGVPLEDKAWAQLRNIASLPFVGPWVAVMPDEHLGIGATVGSVVPTQGAIIPAAVGVDIGCGMAAVRTTLGAGDPPWGTSRVASTIPGRPVATTVFQCDGRTHCSQMTSCAEAEYFLRNCPGTKMDGNRDGVPCERQWCN